MELFGTHIKLKTHYCSVNGEIPVKIDTPYVNLYIQLGGCNAKCEFCEFMDHGIKFDLNLFEEKLIELNKRVQVGKISISGGEPTLHYDLLISIVSIIKKHNPDNFLVMNTNGFNLKRLHENDWIREFGSISLSRHHWNDIINQMIFKTDIISTPELKSIVVDYKDDNIFHLSCNLIKGKIDNPKNVYEYLEYSAYVGIFDVGFVGLMKINQYCKDNIVDVDLRKYESERFINYKKQCYGNSCKCYNYSYIPQNPLNGCVNVYSRHVLGKSDETQFVVFDGKNIKLGFDGNILK